MYIKKNDKEEIYEMRQRGIPENEIARKKGVEISEVEKVIIEWEAALLEKFNPGRIRRTFSRLLGTETVAKAVTSTAEETGQDVDIVEEVLGFRFPIITIKRKDDRSVIYGWNGMYTYCQCVKHRKAAEARGYYAICKKEGEVTGAVYAEV